jgi:hypothetical protein
MIMLLLLAAQPVNFDALETPDPTPKELRGFWATDPAKCRQFMSDGYTDDDGFALGANWISMSGAHGYLQISSQGNLGDGSHYISMRFVVADEGHTSDMQVELNWSGAKPATLKWLTPDEKDTNAAPSSTVYHHCGS